MSIVNSNDNSPQFSKPFYSFSIKEGSYIGVDQPVGKVTATDLDYDGKSPYGQVYYSLSNNTSKFYCLQGGRRERWREGGRERGREGERERGREGGEERGREGEGEGRVGNENRKAQKRNENAPQEGRKWKE